MMIELDFSRSKLRTQSIIEYSDKIIHYDKELEKEANRNDKMVGWMFLPEKYDKEEVKRILKAKEKIQKDSEVLIVIGIGGSYLGAKAVIDALVKKKDVKTEVVFVGNNMSTRYINEVIAHIEDKDFSINVISKSGTTTEPAIAFRIFRQFLIEKYGVEEARKRIYVTTDSTNGALKEIADEEAYETFVIPNTIGGRYSVLTPVGLLPIAVAGVDIVKMLKGAEKAMNEYLNEDIMQNNCYIYAVLRYILYSKYGKTLEIFGIYEENFRSFLEWIKQLFNESEGKNGKGIFSTSAVFTTDLHSIGQYIQEGKRNIFETIINVVDMNEEDIIMTTQENDEDNLNYLENMTLDYINKKTMEGALNAHLEGDVPSILLNLSKLDEENIGFLIYFFEKACAMYCRLLGVDAFNQPGVEAYKKNMGLLLNKP
jgi:glucose-6-phosphate isomerase